MPGNEEKEHVYPLLLWGWGRWHLGSNLALHSWEVSSALYCPEVNSVAPHEIPTHCPELALSDPGHSAPDPLTASSCLMCSVVASRALVPLVASSSTAFTVFSSDVTLVTMTCGITKGPSS